MNAYSPGRIIGVCLFAGLWLVATGSAAAHPVPPQHHDRTILVRLTETTIFIEYTLAINQLTADTDLRPFTGQIDVAGDSRQSYAKVYGPRIGRDLQARLDGQELKLAFTRFELKVEDHLRYTFYYQAPLRLSPDRDMHRFRIYDSNFMGEPGNFQLDIRSEGQAEIKRYVEPRPSPRGKPIKLQDFNPELHERLCASEVVFTAPLPPAAPEPQENPVVTGTLPEQPGFWEVVRSLNVRELFGRASEWGLAILLVLAFIFGAAHALQPGHGKTLVAAYLVGQQGTILHAFFLGLVTTLTHTSVVILLAIVVPLIFPKAGPEVFFFLSLGGGVLVVLLAIWLLLRRITGQADHVHVFGGHHHHHGDHAHDHHHHGDHDHHHHHPAPGQKVGWGALATLGMTGGIVPCWDALALLTFAWVTGQLWLGLPLTLAFSMGLASVLVVMGILVVKFKRFADSRWGEGRLVRSLPIISALLTLALGMWMCHEALSQWGKLPSVIGKPSAFLQR